MGDRAILVGNLGKCYTIAHEDRQRYVALGDVIADRSWLLYSRFIAACYDKALPTMVKYFAKAVTCDFGQIPYGLSIVGRGMMKAMGGRMRS